MSNRFLALIHHHPQPHLRSHSPLPSPSHSWSPLPLPCCPAVLSLRHLVAYCRTAPPSRLALLDPATPLPRSVYIDMELRQAEPEPTRSVLERATSLRLSSKKMKFLFSRYLTYAREQADAALVAHVKDKAREWVASAVASAEGGGADLE